MCLGAVLGVRGALSVFWDETDPLFVAAATAWMEDRSGAAAGMQAVLNVVVNRADNPRWWGRSILQVCLKPMQFSSWNAGSTQLSALREAMDRNDHLWATAIGLAEKAIAGGLADLTFNADSYYASSDPHPPSWDDAAQFTVELGGQKFFRLYLDAPPTS